MERGVEDMEHGVEDLEHGVEDMERGVEDMERGVEDLERGVEDWDFGRVDRHADEFAMEMGKMIDSLNAQTFLSDRIWVASNPLENPLRNIGFIGFMTGSMICFSSMRGIILSER